MLYSTTLLPQNEVMMFRALDRTATVLLLIFRLDAAGHTPARRKDIVSLLNLSPKTVTAYLGSLAQLGVIARQGYRDGYVLTRMGRQLMFGDQTLLQGGQAQQALMTAAQAQDSGDPVSLEHEALEDVNVQAQALMTAAQAQDLSTCKSKGENFPFRKAKQRGKNFPFIDKGEMSSRNISPLPLLKKKKKRNLNLIESSSPSSKNCDFFDSATLLENSGLLFGETVVQNGLPEMPAEIVLGWLAQAYQERRGLRSPASLVYRRLQEGMLPRRQYLEHPEEYLPADFLAAVSATGSMSTDAAADGFPQSVSAAQVEVSDAGNVFATEDTEAVSDASLETLLHGCHFTPAQAWAGCKEQLEGQMERATFWRWVKGARALRFEIQPLGESARGEPNRLVIDAADAESRAWLEGRLTSTLRRMLCGWLGEVEVTFEVMP